MNVILLLVVLLLFTVTVVLSSPRVDMNDKGYRTVGSPWSGETVFTIGPNDSVYMDLTGVGDFSPVLVSPLDEAVEAVVIHSKWIEKNSLSAIKREYNVTVADRNADGSVLLFERGSESGGILFSNPSRDSIVIKMIAQPVS